MGGVGDKGTQHRAWPGRGVLSPPRRQESSVDKSADSGAPNMRGHSQVSLLHLRLLTCQGAQREHLPHGNEGACKALSPGAAGSEGREGPGLLQAEPPADRRAEGFRGLGGASAHLSQGSLALSRGQKMCPKLLPATMSPLPSSPDLTPQSVGLQRASGTPDGVRGPGRQRASLRRLSPARALFHPV